ncbi:MAG: hypothetical protein R3E10_01910 [Gemmatimonadota bacterium]
MVALALWRCLAGAGLALGTVPPVWWLVTRMKRRGVATAYTRKVFHFAIFSVAAAARLAGGTAAVVGLGGVVVLVVLVALVRGDRSPLFGALAREKDRPHAGRLVWVPMLATAVGGLLSEWWWGPYAAVGYLVGGWGDALAEPVGTRWGAHPYRVPGLFGIRAHRTVEGSLAVLGASVLAVLVWAALGGAWCGADTVLAALAIGGVAVVVEAASPHGSDNLTLQVVSSGLAAALLSS